LQFDSDIQTRTLPADGAAVIEIIPPYLPNHQDAGWGFYLENQAGERFDSWDWMPDASTGWPEVPGGRLSLSWQGASFTDKSGNVVELPGGVYDGVFLLANNRSYFAEHARQTRVKIVVGGTVDEDEGLGEPGDDEVVVDEGDD